jgi:hypothetical protein
MQDTWPTVATASYCDVVIDYSIAAKALIAEITAMGANISVHQHRTASFKFKFKFTMTVGLVDRLVVALLATLTMSTTGWHRLSVKEGMLA